MYNYFISGFLTIGLIAALITYVKDRKFGCQYVYSVGLYGLIGGLFGVIVYQSNCMSNEVFSDSINKAKNELAIEAESVFSIVDSELNDFAKCREYKLILTSSKHSFDDTKLKLLRLLEKDASIGHVEDGDGIWIGEVKYGDDITLVYTILASGDDVCIEASRKIIER